MSVLLVTGGSRGIGAAIATAAARKGYDVCVNYTRARDRADNVAAAVRAEGRQALVVQADVSREDDIVRMFRAIDAELGPIRARQQRGHRLRTPGGRRGASGRRTGLRRQR